MKRLACVLVLAGACMAEAGEDLPIHPKSTPPPSQGGTATMRVEGRVCVVEDLRTPAVCGTRDASGLVVTAGSNATTTDADGSFAIDASGTDPALTITGNGIVPTTVGVQPTNALRTVPAVDAALFGDMIATTGIAPEPSTGSILASVTSNGLPSVGTTVTSTPEAPFGPFFDGDTPTNWGIDGTGQRGVVWIPGLQAGDVELVFANGGVETQVGGVTVRNGGITILDTALTGTTF